MADGQTPGGNTTTAATQALLPVTQSDRDAAAACMLRDRRVITAEAMTAGDVGTVLADHFPSGVRGLFERTAQGIPVRTHVGTDCACGWCTAATDEQEVRQQWAEHVAAALTPSALSGDAGEGE